MHRISFRPLSLLAALLFSGALAHAQFDAASVVGTAHDATGAAIPHSHVVLTNIATGVSRETISGDDGRFEFDSVPIGRYRITGDAAGFSSARTGDFELSVNARQRADLTLRAGSTSTTVDVTDRPTLLETESSSRGALIGQKEVEDLPLNGRSYADLALLAPGVRKSFLENQSTTSREAAFNVNGQRSAFNNFLLDGLDNNNYGTSNQGFANENIAPSPDAVEQFRIETNNYSAEYGRAPGAVVNAAVRRGTNQFHGRAWDYIRNTVFNATPEFLPAGVTNPKFIKNQFGGTFGGPVFHDRTFFFMDYEGVRNIFNNNPSTSTLPSANQRAGLFYLNDDATNPANAIALVNPVTGKTYNGVVPAADMTPFARAVLAALPPNTIPGLANNYVIAPRGIINDDKGDARIDHNFSERLFLFGRYSQHATYIFDPPGIPGRAGGNSNGNVSIKNRDLAFGLTWAFRANNLLDVRFGWSKNEGGKFPVGVGDSSLLVENGITDGLPTAANVVRDLNQQSVTGFSQFGAQSSNPQFQNPEIFNPKVNYTLIHGIHSLKFGYESQIVHTQVNDFNPNYGADTYGGQFASPTGVASSNSTLQQAYDLADFMFGNRNQYALTTYAVVNLRQRYNFMYVQDDVKLLPNLTVNAGLRYELVTPQFEADNRLANFDAATKTLIQAHGTSISDRAQVNTPTNNLAPRFGFSYQARPNTVVRGGYGIVYTQWNRAGGENNLTYNGPNVVNASITQARPTSAAALCTSDTQLQSACFRQTQQGYSNVLTSPAYFNPANVTTRYIPKDFVTGYVENYFLGVQQQAGTWLFDVSYVGNKANHLQTLADYNQAIPCIGAACGTNTSVASRRPVQGFGDIEIAYGIGNANYNAFQFKIEKNSRNGLSIINSFTYSRAFDISSGHLETSNGDQSRVDLFNPNASYGPSGYDQPLNDTLGVVYALPYGHGKRWGSDSNALTNAVLGGWELTLINQMTSGLPLNVTYSLSTSSTLYETDLVNYRPNRVGYALAAAPSSRVRTRTALNGFFNASSFATPTTYPFGNLSRNAVRSFTYYDSDLGLHKVFPLYKERVNFDFRAEAFNVFNHPNYGPPGTTFGSSTFGSVTSAFPMRQLQLAGKIIF